MIPTQFFAKLVRTQVMSSGCRSANYHSTEKAVLVDYLMTPTDVSPKTSPDQLTTTIAEANLFAPSKNPHPAVPLHKVQKFPFIPPVLSLLALARLPRTTSADS